MKSRRVFITHGSMAAAALLTAKPFQSLAGNFKKLAGINILEEQISIIHTANLYSRLSPVADRSLYNGLGGFKNTATVIASLKKQIPNVVLLDAGNYSGALNNFDDTTETLQLMHELGYDAVGKGKEDNDISSEHQYIPFIKNDDKEYRLIQKGKIKIAVINTAGFKNDMALINDFANRLRSEHDCNVIICLSSLGYKKTNRHDDINLAASSKNIDIILGAGSDTFMRNPDIAKNRDGREVIINHTGYAGIVLGKIDISFDEYGNKKTIAFDNLMIGTPNNRWMSVTA